MPSLFYCFKIGKILGKYIFIMYTCIYFLFVQPVLNCHTRGDIFCVVLCRYTFTCVCDMWMIRYVYV